MALNEWVSSIAPLTWYQQIMLVKTLNAFSKSDSVMQSLLSELNINYSPNKSVQDNIIGSGSIGYNYIIENAPLSRISFSLDNHGIIEKYALVITKNGLITSVSSYYSNAKYKIDQIKRKMLQSTNNNSDSQCYIFSNCVCNSYPRDLRQSKGEFCQTCFSSWTPQNNCFYPELLTDDCKGAGTLIITC